MDRAARPIGLFTDHSTKQPKEPEDKESRIISAIGRGCQKENAANTRAIPSLPSKTGPRLPRKLREGLRSTISLARRRLGNGSSNFNSTPICAMVMEGHEYYYAP